MNQKQFILITQFLEHVLFPIIFLVFAVMMLGSLINGLKNAGPNDWIGLAHLMRFVFLFFFNVLIAFFLYMTRSRTAVFPDKISEVIVPIIATFWFFTYSWVEMVSFDVNPFVIPQEWMQLFVPMGILINLLGHGIAIAGVLSLANSFGIVAKVNTVVTTGLYGMVRHPIYFGYLLITIGLVCLNPRIIHIIVYVLSMFIQVFRAKIEEQKLAGVSGEYRDYMKKVPFLIPDFRRNTRRQG